MTTRIQDLASIWWRHYANVLPRSVALFHAVAILRLSSIGRFISKTNLGAQVFASLYRRTRPESGEISIRFGGMKFVVEVNDTQGVGANLLEGEFEPAQTALLSKKLKPGMTFVDVGANIGYYTVFASRLVGNSGKVYCFEPEPRNYRILMKNILANKLSNVYPYNAALSDSTGTVILYTDSKNFGAHSLNKFNVYHEDSEVSVVTMRLDDLVGANKIDMIKLDVQGAEPKVVAGAMRTLTAQRPMLVLELWPYGIQKMGDDPSKMIQDLEEIGYRIQVTDDFRRSKTAGSLKDAISEKVSSKDSWLNLFLSTEETIN
jgi:FkbM family methyltransferase